MNIIKTSFLLWTLINSVLFAQEILNRESILDSIVAVVDEGVVLESQLNTQIDIVRQRAEKDGFELPERKIIEEQILEQLILEETQLQRAHMVQLLHLGNPKRRDFLNLNTLSFLSDNLGALKLEVAHEHYLLEMKYICQIVLFHFLLIRN